MVNCQNNRVTTQKVHESYIGEILETLQNHKDVWRPLQTNFFHQQQQLRSFVQTFKPFCWTFETFKNSGTKKIVVKCYNHMQSLATSLSRITSDPKLVFSWKDSDSMMRGKFQMNSIQYGELPKQYSYHTESPWKLYRGEISESLQNHKDVWRPLQTNLFSSTTTASVICAKFQAILLHFWNFQKFRNKKESGKMLESHAISSNLYVVHHKLPKVSFLMKRTLIQWCVESFKWIRFNMVNCQNNTVTTKKVLESYISEILESLQNHKDVWRLLQTNFFHQRQ